MQHGSKCNMTYVAVHFSLLDVAAAAIESTNLSADEILKLLHWCCTLIERSRKFYAFTLFAIE